MIRRVGEKETGTALPKPNSKMSLKRLLWSCLPLFLGELNLWVNLEFAKTSSAFKINSPYWFHTKFANDQWSKSNGFIVNLRKESSIQSAFTKYHRWKVNPWWIHEKDIHYKFTYLLIYTLLLIRIYCSIGIFFWIHFRSKIFLVTLN